MKIYISKNRSNYKVFALIKELLIHSFLDLGHSLSSAEDADIILSMYRHPKNIVKQDGQKLVYLQTEPYKVTTKHVKLANKHDDYPFKAYNADAYWGFDKDDKNESYLVLGYHPLLDFTSEEKISPKYPLGFVGTETPRRKKFFGSLKFDVRYCNGWIQSRKNWDIKGTMQLYKECKINVHINAWDKKESLTPWDRITRFLHNKCFFIMEDVCDCPIDSIVRFDMDNYEDIIQKYINNDKLREDISEECYRIYKNDFDMRDILYEKIKELYHGN